MYGSTTTSVMLKPACQHQKFSHDATCSKKNNVGPSPKTRVLLGSGGGVALWIWKKSKCTSHRSPDHIENPCFGDARYAAMLKHVTSLLSWAQSHKQIRTRPVCGCADEVAHVPGIAQAQGWADGAVDEFLAGSRRPGPLAGTTGPQFAEFERIFHEGSHDRPVGMAPQLLGPLPGPPAPLTPFLHVRACHEEGPFS